MQHKIIIVGSGFAGICMAIRLKAAGINDFVILEKGSQVGGTWFFNRYPGAACDIPSMLYSFSFSLNPNFTRRYAAQPEIEAYIHSLIVKYDLLQHIQFNTTFASANYEDGVWKIHTESGEIKTCQYWVSAVGQLNKPQMPAIEGIDDFAGTSWHSAMWREDIDLTGKRVAVVGSAASAVQLIPEVAKVAEHVVLLQRTPNYLIPRMDRAFLPLERWLFPRFPLLMRWHRLFTHTLLDNVIFPTMRKASWSAKLMKTIANWQLNRQVKDEALKQKLRPDFPIGCKRILICDDFYPSLQRDNVTLDTSPIQKIDTKGVLTNDQHHDVDVIIYATGFQTAEMLSGMDIKGRDNLPLKEHWHQGAQAYHSVCTHNFPNFFMLYGPNSNLGHNSIIAMIEAQVGYIMTLLKSGSPVIEVKEDAEQRHQQWIEAELAKTVWQTGCNNWYRNQYGKQPLNWPLSVTDYKRHMAKVDWFAFVTS